MKQGTYLATHLLPGNVLASLLPGTPAHQLIRCAYAMNRCSPEMGTDDGTMVQVHCRMNRCFLDLSTVDCTMVQVDYRINRCSPAMIMAYRTKVQAFYEAWSPKGILVVKDNESIYSTVGAKDLSQTYPPFTFALWPL